MTNQLFDFPLFENEIDSGAGEGYLMFMVIRQIKILLQVKESTDVGNSPRQITSDLKLHPFVVQKSLAQVRNFNLESLKNIFSSLLQIDRKIKTGQADIKTEIELLIANL